MNLAGTRLQLAAIDLSNHLACPHLTTLERGRAAGHLEAPLRHDPRADALRQRGLAHELAYLEHLRAAGIAVEVVATGDPAAALVRTRELMEAGAPAIAQGALEAGGFFGRPDLLLKVDKPSDLGAYSYEVVDTKLARETRVGTLLQLCLYTELLATVQGEPPELVKVVIPGRNFKPEEYRFAEAAAYCRLLKKRLAAVVAAELDLGATYPLPVGHCDVCRWWQECDRRWRDDDHPTLVDGLSVLHHRQFADWGLGKLEAIADHQGAFARPDRGSASTYLNLREQARLQHQSRGLPVPRHELRPHEEGKGLARLPEPSKGDVFLDFEAARFVEPAGLEYLLGWATIENGAPAYQARWALGPEEEKRNFEDFLDLLTARRESFPDFHVFHFGAYDLAALKRLATRYSTREEALDALLREERFVDLHATLRQGVRIGVESYSLKAIEACYGLARQTDLRQASRALIHIERALELGLPDSMTEEDRAIVEAYNREDCLSARCARDWLEARRAELVATGADLPRPPIGDGQASEDNAERRQRTRGVAERLKAVISADPVEPGSEDAGTLLLAHNIEFFRREGSVNAWEYFRLAALSDDERREDPAAIEGLELIETVGGTTKCPIHRYSYPSQEIDLRGEPDAIAGVDDKVGTVVGIDRGARTVDILKTAKTADRHPASVFLSTYISTTELEKSLCRLGDWIAQHGIASSAGDYRAARDLLLGLPPRGIRAGGLLLGPGEDHLPLACQVALQLDGGVLPIQGPPGAGKTYTAARMIIALVKNGQRVGITANSHKVIRNLLDKVVEAADQIGLDLSCIQKPASDDKGFQATSKIRKAGSNEDVAKGLASGAVQVAAGTAWLWSREEMGNSVDVLFIDEAGQVSLAIALAVAAAAKSLILLGDPQQLEQPTKAAHPDGSSVSALEHLLAGQQTIPADRGLFLAETWRMHPKITRFTSEQFYEGRLRSAPGRDLQLVEVSGLAAAGLYTLEIAHRGNQNSSIEEAAAIAALIDRFLQAGATFTDFRGNTKPLGISDILIVAPYNLQVGELVRQLPSGAQVGTVDKFQGQEAPLVIYSMTSSSPEDAPRGMDFLYSRNRLNVATSRARAACVLVYSPRLLEAACRTPKQVRLANSLCRYVEMATPLELS